MPWAAIIPAAIGAAGSIAGGLLGSKGASDASEDAANASIYATTQQKKMWEQQMKMMQPWITQGTAAINQLGSLMAPGGRLYSGTFTPEEFMANKDPSYDWRLQQGLDSLKAQGLAGGSYGSGNMASSLMGLGQNMASQEWMNAYNRWLNQESTLYNRLAGLAGSGQTQSQQLANLGSQYAGNLGNIAMNNANMQAAAGMSGANSWTNALSGAADQLMGGIGKYLSNLERQNLLNSQTGAGAYYGYTPGSSYDGWADYMGGIGG